MQNQRNISKRTQKFKYKENDFNWISDTSNLIAGENQFSFEPLEEIDLFTSYRYTVDSMKSTLAAHRIEVAEEFISQNGEEGVFLCHTQ